MRTRTFACLGAALVVCAPGFVRAQSADSTAAATPDTLRASAPSSTTPAAKSAAGHNADITYLVPALKDAGYSVSRNPARFLHRVSFSPAYGQFGENELFAFRFGYSPNTWLGYEVALGHNPADGLHALMHTFNVLVRKPLPGRFQPYATLGYGMLTVYPGQAVNADPVTKNALTFGGGLELYIRDDVAIRGEIRGASVLGQELNSPGTVAYDYREYTIGFAFYRSLGS
jgi:opacity protein-like surface antigen